MLTLKGPHFNFVDVETSFLNWVSLDEDSNCKIRISSTQTSIFEKDENVSNYLRKSLFGHINSNVIDAIILNLQQ